MCSFEIRLPSVVDANRRAGSVHAHQLLSTSKHLKKLFDFTDPPNNPQNAYQNRSNVQDKPELPSHLTDQVGSAAR
jgi:hypothetical protein